MGWPELHSIASRQAGVVHRSDVVDSDVPLATFNARARREQWPRPANGVTVLPGSPAGPRQDLWVSLLATGGVAAARSALWLHGRAGAPPRRPEILGPFGRSVARDPRWVVRRSRTLQAAHVTTVDDVPVTTLARTYADLAPRLGERRLLHEVVASIRRGALERHDLRSMLDDLPPGTAGRGAVRSVLQQLEGTRSDSGFEHAVRTGLLDVGIPVHPEPYPFRCEDGVVVHLDIAIPSHMVYVETDGRRYHSDPDVFEADRAKWTQVTRSWRPVWVTWTRWHQAQAEVIDDVRRAMALGPPS